MFYLYMDSKCELLTIRCIDFKDAIERYKKCKKRWPWIKFIAIANAEYLKQEHVELKLIHKGFDS